MKRLILCVIAIALGFGAHQVWVHAQSPTPEEIVSLYFQKIKEGDMTALTECMHSGELARFGAMMIPVIEAGFAAGANGGPFKSFAQGDTLEQIKGYSAQKFFGRFLQWVMALDPGTANLLKQSTVKTIGHISEMTDDGEVLHVVIRMTCQSEGLTIAKMSVIIIRGKVLDKSIIGG